MALTLKGARANADLSQREVCKALKIGKNTLISYEKYRTIPDVTMAQRIADLYGMSLDDIKWENE